MPRTFCLLAILFVVVLPGQTQSTTAQATPTFKLGTVAENPISVPNFTSSGDTQCDGMANAYFALTSPEYSGKYILRISADGKNAKPFLLPPDVGTNGSWKFYVDPGGTIYALFSNAEVPQKHTLIEISSSGDEIRRTVLQLSGVFDPAGFAVLPNGRIMVRGSMVLPVEHTPDGKTPLVRGFLYTAWLDANGRVIHDTGLTPHVHDEFDVSTDRQDTAITTAPTGTFLSVSEKSLNTYDSSGTLLHSSSITKPERDAVADGIQYLDGQAEIEFQVPQEQDILPAPNDGPHPLTPDPNGNKLKKATVFRQVWLFADPEAGTMHGFFALPDFRGSGVCYLGSQNFLYFTVRAMRPIFVEAHPR